MIFQKIHTNASGDIIIALCDADILEKKFEEDNLVLDLTPKFYKDKELDSEDIKKRLYNACTVNACGKESIEFLIGVGVLKESQVKRIQNIPYTILIINGN